MKKYVKAARMLPNISYGRIAETGEKCVMQSNGYWEGPGGRRITSYWRVDKPDLNEKGERVYRQYSMDRHHRFWLETEDAWEDYMEDWLDYPTDAED